MRNRFLFLIFAAALLFSFSFAFGCGVSADNKDGEYTLTFFFFEGSSDNRTIRVSYGDTVPLPLPTVDRENYEFVGWTMDGERIDADAETEFIYNFVVDKTLVALYSSVDNKDPEYTVTFELTYNGVRSYLKDENTPLSVTVKKGETLGDKLPELEPRDDSDDYEFVGWFYKDDNNEEIGITAETVFSDMNVQSFSMVIYAKLKVAFYDVTFELTYHGIRSCLKDENTPLSVTVKDGETLGDKLPELEPRDDYEFVGWFYKNDNNKETRITAETVFSDMNVQSFPMVIYAKLKVYAVTFELTYHGGRSYLKDENTPLSVTVKGGETLGDKLPELEPRDPSDNYEFVGWFYKDDNDEETEITAETAFSDMNVQSFSMVIYAKLKVVFYAVTFELTYNGGRSYLKDENTPLSVTVIDGETLGDKLPELEPRDDSDDYEFVGWFYKNDNNEEIKITAETVFSDMNVQGFPMVIYAKLKKVWIGPF